MARYKKVSRRYYRRARRRRYYRRRRISRNAYRRRYKRSSRNKREYKRIEAYQNINTSMLLNNVNQFGQTIFYFDPDIYYCFIIGTGNQQQPITVGTDIPLGPGQNQRIGAKINPARLRIFGTIELTGLAYRDNNDQIQFQNLYSSLQCCVRILVLQPKYGNSTRANPWESAFSNVNPYVQYRGTANTVRWEPTFFNKLFMRASGFNNYGDFTLNGVGYNYVTPEENRTHFAVIKCPYRRGLGGQFRILKNKVYTIDSSRASIFNFKFKTKKPNQMVWEESIIGENVIVNVPRNPIYIITIPVFPRPLIDATIQMNLNYEFLYTDS